MSVKAPVVRLAPLQFEDLPPHPDFEQGTKAHSRPDLLTFVLTVLDQGRSLVLPTDFNLAFKSHSWKPSPPSNNEVEILAAEVPSSEIQSLAWSTAANPRPKPTKIHDQYWYARRSYHHNMSVKSNAPGTASFEEFIFGLRDNKAEHEAEYTTDLYDAHFICSWTDELTPLIADLKRPITPAQPHYTNVTMSIYEMCHKVSSMAQSRCFPVLILTASGSADEFVTVALPVNISSFSGAFYSNGRNHKEGSDHQTRKPVTIANYVAVERVHKYPSVRENVTDSAGHKVGREKSRGDTGEEIEWVMATASRAKGNIPMTVQRMGVPGAIAKDVGLFLKWIRKVPNDKIKGVDGGFTTTGGSGSISLASESVGGGSGPGRASLERGSVVGGTRGA